MMKEHDDRRSGAATSGKRKKHGWMGEFVNDDAVIISGRGSTEQAPEGRMKQVERTEKIGTGGKLETIDLHSTLSQELDDLPVVQIPTGDLL
jgi:hypothetical protein